MTTTLPASPATGYHQPGKDYAVLSAPGGHLVRTQRTRPWVALLGVHNAAAGTTTWRVHATTTLARTAARWRLDPATSAGYVRQAAPGSWLALVVLARQEDGTYAEASRDTTQVTP